MRPTIVVPGITGTSLQNLYPVDPVSVWSATQVAITELFGPDLTALALDDDATGDLAPDTFVGPLQPLGVAYGSLVRALRCIGGAVTPAYLFPYDWRYSVKQAGARLADFVARVATKTRRLDAGWDGSVNFACHSLGGLVLRSYLTDAFVAGAPAPVGRVVFIAVPHRGSLDAIEVMTRGESLLFGRKDMRKLARTFPSVFELLPSFDAPAVNANGQVIDIWDAENWQDNVTTGPEAVRLQTCLTKAHDVRGALLFPEQAGARPEDVLTIFGRRPDSTLTRVTVARDDEEDIDAWYDFDHATKGDGDGIVPNTSSNIAGAGYAAIEINIADVPLLDLGARASMHAFLPSVDEVGSIACAFFSQKNTADDLVPRGMPDNRFQLLPPL